MNNFIIIIPVYNSAAYILDTISNLYEVTKDFACKILVVVNGCTDNTYNLLLSNKSTYPRLELLYLDKASKVNAMNKGVANCGNVDYVIFMDDDCTVNTENIHECINYMDLHTELSAVSLTPKAVITEKTLIRRFWQKVFAQSTDSQFLFEPKKYMVGRFMIFRKKAWVDIPLEIVADDAWLTRIHWPSVSVMKNSFVYYKPSYSLLQWWKRYSRTIYSLQQMKKMFATTEMKVALKPRKNWKSILNPLLFPDNLYFVVYRIIRRLNKRYYKHRLNSTDFKNYWHRDTTTYFNDSDKK